MKFALLMLTLIVLGLGAAFYLKPDSLTQEEMHQETLQR